ncbi:HAMP domain-containing histidine kinase [Nonomuraea sp. NBC_01738]|uniref:sensor histidine kinase n=1 Tax=Nonomuraea sp. NBC_01738 TaxID=2976003 RepID=UPI002E0F534A|nr:HAMP domain-containing histidine kinase [Nonomuraea sp. NBC_01738]
MFVGGSVRGRLTLFASITMAALCLLVNTLVLIAVRETAEEYRSSDIIASALRVVHLIKRGALPSVLLTDAEGVQVLNSTGRVVSASPNLVGKTRLTAMTPQADNAGGTEERCDLPGFTGRCMIVASFRVYEDDGDWMVYTMGDVVPWYVNPAALAFLIGVSVGMTVVTWLGTSRTVARTLAPVDDIRAKLADISGSDLHQRVPVPPTKDEIHALAETANRTLDRLEAAVEQQRRFASDASHDLRSPITAMRAQVEEAMLYPDEADWERTGQALLASLDRLQAIVTDLLTLARLDAGAPAACDNVDLAQLVVAETSRPRGKRVASALEAGVEVVGDKLQLARLLTNLLDNAERHAESIVTVSLARRDGRAVLEVTDDGAGIAQDQREIVFNRFTRLDASRNRDAGGTGLGLPIAREIAMAHEGTLTIADSELGARFVLTLPLKEG